MEETTLQEIRDALSIIVQDPDVSKYTDKTSDLGVWLQFAGIINSYLQEDDDGIVSVSSEDATCMNSVCYGDPIKVKDGDFESAGNLLRAVWRAPKKRSEIVDVPRAPSSPIITEVAPVSAGSCTDSSGVCFGLRDDPSTQELFRDIMSTRQHWAPNDLVAALSIIRAQLQAAKAAKMGAISEITQPEYDDWLAKSVVVTIDVGPYLLMKLAQQYRALVKISGDYITMERGDNVIKVIDSFSFLGDGAAFASGLKIKNKVVKYNPIPRAAYLLAEIFFRFRGIAKGDSGALRAAGYSPNEVSKARLSAVPKLLEHKRRIEGGVVQTTQNKIQAVVEKIATDFNKLQHPPGDVDMIIDAVANVCANYLDEAGMSDYVVQAGKLIEDKLKMFVSVLDSVPAGIPLIEKVKKLSQVSGCSSVKEAVDKLSFERQHRNLNNYTQYSFKNLASVGGNNAVPAVDTVLKGARIRHFIDNNIKVKCTDMVMYGVAYGHMVDPLKSDGVNLKLFDSHPQKLAAHRVDVGNIYAVAQDLDALKSGQTVVIVDDTNTSSQVKQDEVISLAKMGVNITAGQSGDWNKLCKFAEVGATSKGKNLTIISKISIANFPAMETGFHSLFFPSSKGVATDQPFKFVAVYKFGKLHNLEAFVVLSNAPSVKEIKGKSFVQYCVNQISVAIGLTNKALSEYVSSGAYSGFVSREFMNVVLFKIIAALAVPHPWYAAVHKSSVVYGSASVQNVSSEEELKDLDPSFEMYDWE